jgi:hypothetical protein
MPKRSSGNTPQPQTQKRIDDQAAESILKKLGEKSGLRLHGREDSPQGLLIHTLADTQTTSVTQHEFDSGGGPFRFVTHQGKARRFPIDAWPPYRQCLAAHLELMLPPVKLTRFQSPLPAKLSH